MKQNPNPYINPDFSGLPVDHPARENRMLTELQEMALPVLMWFFDTDRSLGSGRTELAAHVVIRLAKRKREIYITDPSRVLHQLGGMYSSKRLFVERIFDVAKRHYPRSMFKFNQARMTLTYLGERPE